MRHGELRTESVVDVYVTQFCKGLSEAVRRWLLPRRKTAHSQPIEHHFRARLAGKGFYAQGRSYLGRENLSGVGDHLGQVIGNRPQRIFRVRVCPSDDRNEQAKRLSLAFARRSSIVGRLSRTRVSSVIRIFPSISSIGTLKSTRTRTRRPFTPKSRTDNLSIVPRSNYKICFRRSTQRLE